MLKLHIVGLFLCAWNSFAQQWQQIEDFPGTPRDDGSSFVIDSFAYTGLGRDNGFSCMRDFYRYNGITMNWSSCASLPEGKERQYAVGAAANGRGYVFGGALCDGSFSNELWEFDPSLNIWSLLAPMPAEGRGGAVHFVLGDTLYIVGGKNQQGILSEVWAYTIPTNQWSQKNALPGNGIWRGTSFSFNNLGYVGLGRNNLNNQTALNTDFYQYNPQTDQWVVLTNPGLTPRSYIGTASANHLVSFFGGLDDQNAVLNDFQVLDLNTWTLSSSIPFSSTPRKGVMCFAFGPDFYVTTGINNSERFKETWRISNVLEIGHLKQWKLEIFPNPCSTFLLVSIPENEVVDIYDVHGNQVQSLFGSNSVTQIDVSHWPNGIYVLRSSEVIQRFQVLH